MGAGRGEGDAPLTQAGMEGPVCAPGGAGAARPQPPSEPQGSWRPPGPTGRQVGGGCQELRHAGPIGSRLGNFEPGGGKAHFSPNLQDIIKLGTSSRTLLPILEGMSKPDTETAVEVRDRDTETPRREQSPEAPRARCGQYWVLGP